MEPRPRYYGDKGGTLCMDTLRKLFVRASKLLLHPKDVPDIKLVEGKEAINHKNKQGNKRDDNITLYELTEELGSHEKVKKAINTVIPNIVDDVTKEERVDKKSSEETIN